MALLEEFARETSRARFTFAALEDTESNLDRLRRWLEKVSHRDFFAAPHAGPAREVFARCEQAHEIFAGQVLEHGECGTASSVIATDDES